MEPRREFGDVMYSNNSRTKHVFVYDMDVEQHEKLLQGLDTNCLAVAVSTGQAVEKLRDTLNDPLLGTLHVLGHGQPGAITLGGETIDTHKWVHSVADSDGGAPVFAFEESGAQAQTRKNLEINFWSCRTGEGEIGMNFLNTVAQTTGATVNASSDLVGHEAQGGSWNLDVRAMPRAPFSADALSAYTQVLSLPGVVDYSTLDSWFTDGTFVASATTVRDFPLSIAEMAYLEQKLGDSPLPAGIQFYVQDTVENILDARVNPSKEYRVAVEDAHQITVVPLVGNGATLADVQEVLGLPNVNIEDSTYNIKDDAATIIGAVGDSAAYAVLDGASDIAVSGASVLQAAGLLGSAQSLTFDFKIVDTASKILDALEAEGSQRTVVLDAESVHAADATVLQAQTLMTSNQDDATAISYSIRDTGENIASNLDAEDPVVSSATPSPQDSASRGGVEPGYAVYMTEAKISQIKALESAGEGAIVDYEIIDTFSELVTGGNESYVVNAESIHITDVSVVDLLNSELEGWIAGTGVNAPATFEISDTQSALLNIGVDVAVLSEATSVTVENAMTITELEILFSSTGLAASSFENFKYTVLDDAETLLSELRTDPASELAGLIRAAQTYEAVDATFEEAYASSEIADTKFSYSLDGELTSANLPAEGITLEQARVLLVDNNLSTVGGPVRIAMDADELVAGLAATGTLTFPNQFTSTNVQLVATDASLSDLSALQGYLEDGDLSLPVVGKLSADVAVESLTLAQAQLLVNFDAVPEGAGISADWSNLSNVGEGQGHAYWMDNGFAVEAIVSTSDVADLTQLETLVDANFAFSLDDSWQPGAVETFSPTTVVEADLSLTDSKLDPEIFGDNQWADTYVLTVSAPGSVTLRHDGLGGMGGAAGGLPDAFLYLTDLNGNVLAHNDDSEGLDSLITYSFVAAGDYRVVATNFGYEGAEEEFADRLGNYRLTIESGDASFTGQLGNIVALTVEEAQTLMDATNAEEAFYVLEGDKTLISDLIAFNATLNPDPQYDYIAGAQQINLSNLVLDDSVHFASAALDGLNIEYTLDESLFLEPPSLLIEQAKFVEGALNVPDYNLISLSATDLVEELGGEADPALVEVLSNALSRSFAAEDALNLDTLAALDPSVSAAQALTRLEDLGVTFESLAVVGINVDLSLAEVASFEQLLANPGSLSVSAPIVVTSSDIETLTGVDDVKPLVDAINLGESATITFKDLSPADAVDLAEGMSFYGPTVVAFEWTNGPRAVEINEADYNDYTQSLLTVIEGGCWTVL